MDPFPSTLQTWDNFIPNAHFVKAMVIPRAMMQIPTMMWQSRVLQLWTNLDHHQCVSHRMKIANFWRKNASYATAATTFSTTIRCHLFYPRHRRRPTKIWNQHLNLRRLKLKLRRPCHHFQYPIWLEYNNDGGVFFKPVDHRARDSPSTNEWDLQRIDENSIDMLAIIFTHDLYPKS